MPTQIERDAAACGVCKFISDDWRTWHFQSRGNTRIFHTVDLAGFDASGECSCPHFQIRIRPLLVARTIKPHESRAKCKHIDRAERILCFRIKKQMFQQPEPDPT